MADSAAVPDFSVYANAPAGAPPPSADAATKDAADVPDFSAYANQGGDSARTAAPANPGVLANSPDDTALSSAAKGAGTAAIQGVADIPGMAGNMNNFGNYIGARVESYLTGKPLDQVMADRVQRNNALQGFFDAHNPLPGAFSTKELTGDEIAAPVLKQTGQYEPSTTAGRIGMTGVRAATGSALTAGVGSVPEAIAAGGAGAVPKAFASAAASAVPKGLVAGAAGQGATEATGDPLAGLAAGVIAPEVAGRTVLPVATAAKNYVAPVIPSMRPGVAAEMVGKAATDPQAALDATKTAPQQIIPGSTPNLAEQTGDIGLAQATKNATIADPTFAARQMANAGDQNAARANAIDALAPAGGDVMSPTTVLNQHLSDLDATHDNIINQLSQQADTLNRRIPDNFDPEAAGTNLRGAIQVADDAAAKARSHLYSLVDPDNNLAVVTAPAREAAQDIAKKIDPSVSIPSPIAMPVINMAANLGDVTPFNKLTALDTTITGAMAQAKRTGDYVGRSQLAQLKTAVMGSINNAVDNQHAWEQGAISRGELNPAQSMQARFKQDAPQVDSIGNSGRDTSSNDSARAVAVSGMAAPVSAGSGVGEIQGQGGLRASAGDQGIQSLLGSRGDNNAGSIAAGTGLQESGTPNAGTTTGSVGRGPGTPASGVAPTPPPLTPNFNADAATRLAAAKQAHAEYAQTYREQPIKSTLATNGFAGQYRNAASTIPAKAFPAGNTGYQTTGAFLKAANNSPEAISAIQDMAMARLRGAMKGESLEPKALAAWKQNYGQALRAIDEASPGFSSRFDTAATATQTLNDARTAKITDLKAAQEGAAARLMGANTPGEVKTRVSDIIRAKDGPTQIRSLMARMHNDPAAVQGLQRAGVEAILDNVSNAGTAGGEHIISGAKLGSLLAKNGDAIEALLGKDGLTNMKAVAADVERSQKALDNTRARSGSDTGANVFRKMQEIATKAGHLSIGGAMSIAGIEALHSGDLMGAAGIAGAAGLRAGLGKLRANGIEKVNDLYLEALENPEVGKAMLQTYIDRHGRPNPSALVRLGQTVEQSARLLAPLQQTATEQREGRKHGGAVQKKSHDFLVNRLIKLVDLAKRQENKTTEPLLDAPDPVIVKALKLSKQSI